MQRGYTLTSLRATDRRRKNDLVRPNADRRRIRGWWAPPLRRTRTNSPLLGRRLSQYETKTLRIWAPDLLTDTDIYINICRKIEKGKYIGIDTDGIIRPGPEMVREEGWVVEAGRQAQLVHPATLPETRSFVESAHRLYPGIAAEVMSIYINGGDPKYGDFPVKALPDDGYPHGRRISKKIIESARGDAIFLKAIACAIKALIYSERLE